MTVIREVVGETLRGIRLRQRRTLRQVSAAARVSLGYLSEVERGQKEPSSELLAAICEALDVRQSDLYAEVSDVMRRQERLADRAHLASAGGGAAAAGVRLTPAGISAPGLVGPSLPAGVGIGLPAGVSKGLPAGVSKGLPAGVGTGLAPRGPSARAATAA